jgi:hypothetical protein
MQPAKTPRARLGNWSHRDRGVGDRHFSSSFFSSALQLQFQSLRADDMHFADALSRGFC